MKILLVEDEPATADFLTRLLQDHRYTVDRATDGQMGLDLASQWFYDLLLLDVKLPNLDGFCVCRNLRAQGNKTPILILTAQHAKDDVIRGLDAGADDYIVKPCDPEQLLARIRALSRRTLETLTPVLTWGDLRLEPISRQVTYRQQPLVLRPKEFSLLELFLRQPQRVFSRSTILDQVWTVDDFPSENAVTNLVKDLRQKLTAAGLPEDMIKTVYGLGYYLQPPLAIAQTADANLTADPEKPEPANALSRPLHAPLVELGQLTQQFHSLLKQRLACLQETADQLQLGRLEDSLRHQAREAAHRLAGSLGTYGYCRGSELARTLENLLQGNRPLEPQQITNFNQLLAQLAQAVTEPDEQSLQGWPDFPTGSGPTPIDAQPLVLVISDDDALAEALQQEALAWDLRIEVVPDWSEKQQQFIPAPPAIALVELQGAIPHDVGTDWLRQLKQQFPSVPVLTLAQQDTLTNRIATSRLGSARFLPKSVTPTQICQAIAQLLPQPPARPSTVLIVDDDPTLLTALAGLLQPWGLQVTGLSDPSQFWQVLTQTKPDLLLLDVEMPMFNGIELCQVVRQDAQYGNLPILVITAHTDPESVQQIFEAGADDLISKPIVGPQLVTRVISRIERSRLWQQLEHLRRRQAQIWQQHPWNHSRVSAALAEGTWQESLKEDSRITELSLLAHSFNRTAEQLQQSFDRIKTALQESEEKFTTIFRTSPDSIALTTIDDGGRYVEVNDSFLKLTGYDRQEVIGRTTADLNLSIDPQQDVELLNLLQQQGAVQNFEYHYRSKAGDLGTALISFQVVELDGQPHVLTVARDISDRKQLEEALQISEAKVTDILNSAIASISSLQVFSDGVWRLNHISAGCEVISGYTPEELIADPDLWVSRIVPTDWQVVAPEIYANLFAEQTGTYEYRFRHKDGSVRWFSQTNRSRWDETQDCWFVTAVTSDISDRKQAEIALRQSEERFQQLAAASPGVIYTVVEDPEGPIRYEYLSPAFEDIHEIPITEVLQDATLTFQQVHPEDRAAYQQAVAQSSQTMQPFRHAWRIITPAGQVKWIQANSRPERRPNGELVWHGIVMDITDRKQAEQKLQQALQELDTHFENSPLAIVQWDQEFRILRWSQQAERMFGWTADEVKHLSWQEWDFVYREDRDRVNAELAPLLHQAVTHQTIENRNYTKDGRVILCQWFTSAVFDNDGNLSSLLSFAEDITDRKQAEEILRQSEATNQALIRAIPDLMIRMHRDGTYLAVYPSNTVKLLHPEKMRPGITIFEMLPEEVANERMCYVEQVLEDGQVRTYEFQLMVEDDLRYEEARIVPCGPDEVLVIIRDISDRYQIDRLKDEFISVVSHELRTPLTAIRGSLGMLNMGVLDDEPETVKQMLQVALNSSDRLVRLVNDILDLERLESGKVQLMMEPCDADDLINQAVESVYPLAIQKQVKLEVLPISLDLWAAPDAIVQTLTNLLSNAIKFSAPGQTVWVQAQPILGEGGRNGEGRMKHGAWEMKSGNQAGKVHPPPTFRIQNHPPADSPLPTPYILFTVKDQGSGIPADKLETIFGRFQQVNVSDSRQKGGSGLGLAICKSIVQQHNGLIWAESEIGQGSCFYFTLPLSQP